ncbi:MAG: hypothetical protein QE271_10770 [Bacteriovoracaceae bacterium]|nr:hypothetical protein [Bacteriovoracaceae bacterium]
MKIVLNSFLLLFFSFASFGKEIVKDLCPIFISYPNECKLIKELENQNRFNDPEYVNAIKRELNNFQKFKNIFNNKKMEFQVINTTICEQPDSFLNIFYFEYAHYSNDSSGNIQNEQSVKLYKIDENENRSMWAYVVDQYLEAFSEWEDILQKKRMIRKYIPSCKKLLQN